MEFSYEFKCFYEEDKNHGNGKEIVSKTKQETKNFIKRGLRFLTVKSRVQGSMHDKLENT